MPLVLLIKFLLSRLIVFECPDRQLAIMLGQSKHVAFQAGIDEIIDSGIAKANCRSIVCCVAIVYLLNVGPDNGAETHGTWHGRCVEFTAG